MTFSRKTFAFLRDLERNNHKDWFHENKARYEADALEPMLAFIRDLEPRLAKIAPHIAVSDKKVGGSMMRIYRDTRFSKDKSPYNTHLGARFHHAKSKAGPGFYVRITAKECWLGTGIWQPDGPLLQKIRKAIVADPKAWKAARDAKAFRDAWGELQGESLKRPPKGFDPEHAFVEDLKRKDYVGFTSMKPSAAHARDFPQVVVRSLKASAKLMGFLCEALRLPY